MIEFFNLGVLVLLIGMVGEVLLLCLQWCTDSFCKSSRHLPQDRYRVGSSRWKAHKTSMINSVSHTFTLFSPIRHCGKLYQVVPDNFVIAPIQLALVGA